MFKIFPENLGTIPRRCFYGFLSAFVFFAPKKWGGAPVRERNIQVCTGAGEVFRALPLEAQNTL